MKNIVVRLARAADVPFVRELAATSLLHGIPPTRDVGPEAVSDLARRSYANLESTFKNRPDFFIMVAEDRTAAAPRPLLGYIMLDFTSVEPSTGETQCFIIDLAVSRSQWGRGTTHQLIAKASQVAAARGLRYLVGTVSVNNLRTLKIAQEALGFQIERHQIVRRCLDPIPE